jgi:tetratricopeptide (TPR) repeat protein
VGLDKEELVSMLLDRSAEDQRLHRRLVVRAAHATGGTAELSVWKDALDDALQTEDFVPYGGAHDYASGIEEVIDGLEDLLREGQAESVIELAEHGLAAVDESVEHVDDSDGWMGALLGRLQELHLEACRQARPDPANLAERLFELEMESAFDTFDHAFVAYADILGEAGLAVYRRLAESEWAKIGALGPGEEDRGGSSERYWITSIMEEMARADGDLEALVAVKSRDLSLPYAFLQIAELYRDAGDPDRALDWAERGWRAFSDTRRDERLRVFIADAYQRRGRHDEAMTLVWEAFAEHPYLESYRQLERRAGAAGQWPAWRDRALSLIRERIAGKAAEPPGHRLWLPGPSRDHSLLVEIFLHEGDTDGAWHEAETGGCSEGLWLVLAKQRETSHPADSIRVYKGHVASLLRNTGDRVYEEAVGTLEKVRELLARSGQEAAFRPLLTEVRATHRRKRNLMKMLDRKGW